LENFLVAKKRKRKRPQTWQHNELIIPSLPTLR
jgi:hypothetical protein